MMEKKEIEQILQEGEGYKIEFKEGVNTDLPKGLDPKDFGKKSVSRNPLIASLFHRLGYIEKMGTGILRIRNALAEAGIKGPVFTFDSFFTVEFPRMPSVKTPVKTPDLIITLLRDNQEMTLAMVAETIEKSLSAVERASAKLVKDGRMRYVGPQKGGHWEIMN